MRAFLNTIIFALIFLLSGVGITYAAGTDLVTFTTMPKSPGALEKITVSIESFAVDLNSANIVWNVDKEFVKDGIAIAVGFRDVAKIKADLES